MSDESRSDSQLTPQALDVLRRIVEDTKDLREINLGETGPAVIFQAD
jgi:hypothetical protein